MKLFTPILAVTVAAAVIVPCAFAQDTTAVETKLKQMEDTWVKSFLEADHGAATVEQMLADDFAGVNPKGEKRDKSQMLAEMKKETDTTTSATNEDMDVHVYAPNLATVVGITTEKGKDKNGKAFNRSYGWTDTWMERNEKWQCIAEAVTELPKKK